MQFCIPDAAAVTATVSFVSASGVCCGDNVTLAFSSGPSIPCAASNFSVLSSKNGTVVAHSPAFVQCVASSITVAFTCSSGCPIANGDSVGVRITGWRNPSGAQAATSVTVTAGLDNMESAAGVGPLYIQSTSAAPTTSVPITSSVPLPASTAPPTTTTPTCSYDTTCGCPPGCARGSGSLSCSECPKGFYSSVCNNASTVCNPCPSGSYCGQG
jgi:hypothetical protein